MRANTTWREWLWAPLCAAFVLIAGLAGAQAPAASPPDARAPVIKMADFLGKTQKLSVTVRASYDTAQASGQKVEWNEIRRLTLSRPDHLRMEAEKSNGVHTLVVFDGKEISAFDEAARAYAQTPQRGGVGMTPSCTSSAILACACRWRPSSRAARRTTSRAEFSRWSTWRRPGSWAPRLTISSGGRTPSTSRSGSATETSRYLSASC